MTRVLIIGAGMSGLAMGAQLRRSGRTDFTIYDKAEAVGGTWHHHRYPGVRCDVPSRLYRFSFAPNPGWTEVFARGADIAAYVERVTDDEGLRSHLRLGEEVTSCRWDGRRWQLRTASGVEDAGDVLVAATGLLHHWREPEIAGLHDFAGHLAFSQAWDPATPVDGRVGLIGNGSTGVQIATEVGQTAQQLTVFQRTPQWVLPTFGDGELSRAGRWLWARVPALQRASYGINRRLIEHGVGAAVVKEGWQRRLVERLVRRHLASVKDDELRRALTPTDTIMCRRLILSGSYYDTLQQPNVSLVTSPIERVVPEGVRTVDGRVHQLDTLAVATGYDRHAYVRPMELQGADGLDLDQAWADSPYAYRTVALPGFPSFFMLVGPHSPVGNHSVVAVAETQVAYVMQWLDLVESGRLPPGAPTASATEAYNRRLEEALPDTVWAAGCGGWYIAPNGLPDAWPWSAQEHRDLVAEVRAEDWAPA